VINHVVKASSILDFVIGGKRVHPQSHITKLISENQRAARREANSYARRYPNRKVAQLQSEFKREEFIKRFNMVEGFREKQDDYRSWTFWTYANRAGPFSVRQAFLLGGSLGDFAKLLITKLI
jgi:hypothetical protein